MQYDVVVHGEKGKGKVHKNFMATACCKLLWKVHKQLIEAMSLKSFDWEKLRQQSLVPSPLAYNLLPDLLFVAVALKTAIMDWQKI